MIYKTYIFKLLHVVLHNPKEAEQTPKHERLRRMFQLRNFDFVRNNTVPVLYQRFVAHLSFTKLLNTKKYTNAITQLTETSIKISVGFVSFVLIPTSRYFLP